MLDLETNKLSHRSPLESFRTFVDSCGAFRYRFNKRIFRTIICFPDSLFWFHKWPFGSYNSTKGIWELGRHDFGKMESILEWKIDLHVHWIFITAVNTSNSVGKVSERSTMIKNRLKFSSMYYSALATWNFMRMQHTGRTKNRWFWNAILFCFSITLVHHRSLVRWRTLKGIYIFRLLDNCIALLVLIGRNISEIACLKKILEAILIYTCNSLNSTRHVNFRWYCLDRPSSVPT